MQSNEKKRQNPLTASRIVGILYNNSVMEEEEYILPNCDYLLTTDDRLLKYKSEQIEIIDPMEFIKRIGGENDD